MERQKILQIQTKIAKVREGFEGGLYDLNEARSKIVNYQEAIGKSEQEIGRLSGIGHQNSNVNIDELKNELETLAQSNLDKATFIEKHDIISKLGIRVYPSEDLKTMKIKCSLNSGKDGSDQSSDGYAIIQFGSAIRQLRDYHVIPILSGLTTTQRTISNQNRTLPKKSPFVFSCLCLLALFAQT